MLQKHIPMSSLMNESVISIHNLSHTYNQNLKVINQLSIDVKKHDFVTLIGPSGCGKSTLFKLITKLIGNYQGEIIIKGTPLEDSKERLGYMPQKDLLLPWRTLYQNVTLPLELMKKSIDEATILESLETFGLKEFKDHFPGQLSGGQKQRAALLRTFLMGNDLVLLDEPFAALDYLTKRTLQKWLLAIFKKLDKSVIFITHDIDEAIVLSNRIIVLSELPATVLKEFVVADFKNKEELKEAILHLIM